MATDGQPRDGHNRFTRTLEGAQKDARAAELRGKGWTYQRIADELGWANKGDAHHAVKRVLDATLREAGDSLRELERARLDRLSAAAWEVLDRQHVTVNNGQIIRLGGEPLLDDAPALQAIDRLLRISESRRKLDGLDAPSRVSVDAQQLGDEIANLFDRLGTPPADDPADG
ncbi:hypothetical protein [Streptomyces niveus]|uniref:hypothetical protein n=1 Tax=Streptomyces niveus TaxID=193462 RepID=UPI00343EF550